MAATQNQENRNQSPHASVVIGNCRELGRQFALKRMEVAPLAIQSSQQSYLLQGRFGYREEVQVQVQEGAGTVTELSIQDHSLSYGPAIDPSACHNPDMDVLTGLHRSPSRETGRIRKTVQFCDEADIYEFDKGNPTKSPVSDVEDDDGNDSDDDDNNNNVDDKINTHSNNSSHDNHKRDEDDLWSFSSTPPLVTPSESPTSLESPLSPMTPMTPVSPAMTIPLPSPVSVPLLPLPDITPTRKNTSQKVSFRSNLVLRELEKQPPPRNSPDDHRDVSPQSLLLFPLQRSTRPARSTPGEHHPDPSRAQPSHLPPSSPHDGPPPTSSVAVPHPFLVHSIDQANDSSIMSSDMALVIEPPQSPQNQTQSNDAEVDSLWSDDSEQTASPQDKPIGLPPLVIKNQPAFGDTVLEELERITNHKTRSYKEYHTPNVVFASPGPATPDEACIDLKSPHDKPVLEEPVWQRIEQTDIVQRTPPLSHGRLYIRILAAENLDFPIDTDSPCMVSCVVYDGQSEMETAVHPLEHTIQFGHEFSIDVGPETELTLTLRVHKPHGLSLKTLVATRRDILRYINKQNGALAQARVAFSAIEKQCRSKMRMASFALVNGWYRPRQGLSPKQSISREKAVGKINAQLFFLPRSPTETTPPPPHLRACEEALHIRRFYHTCWQTGPMSQLGGDLNYWKRRYFCLRGWRLFSYADETCRSARTVVDLDRATMLCADQHVLLERQAGQSRPKGWTGETRGSAAHKVASSTSSATSVAASAAWTGSAAITNDTSSIKHAFQITFGQHQCIAYFCDSAQERNQWLEILKTVLERIPHWPDWLQASNADDSDEEDGEAMRLFP